MRWSATWRSFSSKAESSFDLPLEVVLLLLQLLAEACARRLQLVGFDLIDAGGHAALEGQDVFRPHARERALVVAVKVHERLKGALRAAGEQPVDRPLLVPLQMVGEEVAQEEFPDVLADRRLDEGEVLLETLVAERYAQERMKAGRGVAIDPIAIQERDNVVRVWRELGLRNPGKVLLDTVALVRQDQARLVEAVAPKHAADCVGEELAHRVGEQAGLQRLLARPAAVAIGWVAG